KPGKLPCEANSRTEVVVIIFVPRRPGIWRVLPEKGDRGVFAARARLHPIAEAGSGHAPNRCGTPDSCRHQAVAFVGHSKIIPSQTEIEGEFSGRFEVVLKEHAEFIRMEIAKPPWERLVILERAQLRRVLHEAKLRDAR